MINYNSQPGFLGILTIFASIFLPVYLEKNLELMTNSEHIPDIYIFINFIYGNQAFS